MPREIEVIKSAGNRVLDHPDLQTGEAPGAVREGAQLLILAAGPGNGDEFQGSSKAVTQEHGDG